MAAYAITITETNCGCGREHSRLWAIYSDLAEARARGAAIETQGIKRADLYGEDGFHEVLVNRK